MRMGVPKATPAEVSQLINPERSISFSAHPPLGWPDENEFDWYLLLTGDGGSKFFVGCGSL